MFPLSISVWEWDRSWHDDVVHLETIGVEALCRSRKGASAASDSWPISVAEHILAGLFRLWGFILTHFVSRHLSHYATTA